MINNPPNFASFSSSAIRERKRAEFYIFVTRLSVCPCCSHLEKNEKRCIYIYIEPNVICDDGQTIDASSTRNEPARDKSQLEKQEYGIADHHPGVLAQPPPTLRLIILFDPVFAPRPIAFPASRTGFSSTFPSSSNGERKARGIFSLSLAFHRYFQFRRTARYKNGENGRIALPSKWNTFKK